MTLTAMRSETTTTWLRAVRWATVVGTVLFLAGQATLPVLPDTIEAAFPGMVAQRDH